MSLIASGDILIHLRKLIKKRKKPRLFHIWKILLKSANIQNIQNKKRKSNKRTSNSLSNPNKTLRRGKHRYR